jgi:hypothetical protein
LMGFRKSLICRLGVMKTDVWGQTYRKIGEILSLPHGAIVTTN